jgi:hypothetical protein
VRSFSIGPLGARSFVIAFNELVFAPIVEVAEAVLVVIKKGERSG